MRRWLRSFSLISSTLLLTAVSLPLPIVHPRTPIAWAATTEDRKAEADRLYAQSVDEYLTSQFQSAITSLEQAIAIYEDINDYAGEAAALNNMGNAYGQLGNFPRALTLYEEALEIATTHNIPLRQGEALTGLGYVQSSLGRYEDAIKYYGQARDMARSIDDLWGESDALIGLGYAYNTLRQFDQAAEAYQRVLEISDQISDDWGRTDALNGLGSVYSEQGSYQQAISVYLQALAVARRIDTPDAEAEIFINLGNAYYWLTDYAQAIESYQQALVVQREIGYVEAEGRTLGNIGLILSIQNQPELAIVFLKQSINIREAIRSTNAELSQELQQSYTDVVANDYRRLADLLLQQDRVLEAQQVLELLKIQELDDYLRDVRGNEETAQGLDLWQTEQAILDRYNAMINELAVTANSATGSYGGHIHEAQPRITLNDSSLSETANFNNFVSTPEVSGLIEQLRRSARGQNLNPSFLENLKDNLQELDQPAVLLYPLILDDRLELVLIQPNADPIRKTVPVTRLELNQAIADFRSEVTNPTSTSTVASQKLYDWLVGSIEDELTESGAETLIFASDGQLRYVPLSALYDGEQWLIERYQINYITAATVTDFTYQHPATTSLRVMAAAFSDTDQRYRFEVGERQFSFSGLNAAGTEVENIAAEIPNTTQFFNQDFTRANVEPNMNAYTIVHLATHAEFVPGQPEESFILFGDGDVVTLREIADWSLPNVDLIVLSACRTAIGGELGTGEEILGFGYQIQRTGAKAALASLWYVDDGGTQFLMNAFYAALEQHGGSPAKALQEAQIALITGDFSALGLQDQMSAEQLRSLNRPYYWAPFILIGNGV